MTCEEKRKKAFSPYGPREISPDERIEYVTWITKEESDEVLDEVEEAIIESDDSSEPYDPTEDLDGSS